MPNIWGISTSRSPSFKLVRSERVRGKKADDFSEWQASTLHPIFPFIPDQVERIIDSLSRRAHSCNQTKWCLH